MGILVKNVSHLNPIGSEGVLQSYGCIPHALHPEILRPSPQTIIICYHCCCCLILVLLYKCKVQHKHGISMLSSGARPRSLQRLEIEVSWKNILALLWPWHHSSAPPVLPPFPSRGPCEIVTELTSCITTTVTRCSCRSRESWSL